MFKCGIEVVMGAPHLQDSGETLPAEDSDSDLDEEAALRFYREVEARSKSKRKRRAPEAEE